MVFLKKKVRTETLSEYLAEIRKQHGLTIEEVSGKSGITIKFIELLESGAFQKLPPDVYVMGFLRQLAVIYAVPADPLIEQLKKERGIAVHVAAQPERGQRAKSFLADKLVLTPKLLSIGAATLFIGATLAYIGVELVSVSTAPALNIIEPTQGQLIKQSFVRISGETTPGSTLTVNDQNNIFVDEQGKFATTVPVVSGQPELLFKSLNKFNKTTSKRVPIVVDLGSAVAASQIPDPAHANLTLKLDFLQPVSIGLTVDGVTLPIENEAAGASKVVTAINDVLVSTSDAGNTVVTINDQKLGRLGKPGDQMTNIPFSVQSVTVMANSFSRANNKPVQD